MKRFQRIHQIYLFAACNTLNALLLLIVLNVLFGAFYFVRDRLKASSADARVSEYRKRFADYQAYTRYSLAEVNALLTEQDAMGAAGLVFEPWLQFRNPTVSGRYLNTTALGYRATVEPQPRPGTPLKVYLFGGSTTFGYGVPDKDTIPSYLQRTLERQNPKVSFSVRNLGQAFYYSSQEQLSFLSLLKGADVPDWAVFIDGGNDTAQLALRHDEPIYTPALRAMWRQRSEPAAASAMLFWHLPIGRAVRSLANRVRSGQAASPQDEDQHRLISDDTHLTAAERAQIVDYVVSRYLTNIRITRAICKDFEIRCLFVWQPHPAYKYDRRLHKEFPFKGPVPEYFTDIFERLENHREPGFVYLGDLLYNRSEKSYVDDVHYNEAVNEAIAEEISRRVRPEYRNVPKPPVSVRLSNSP